MSPAIPVGLALLLIGAGLFLAQLWLQPWSPETFLKLMLTGAVALGLTVVFGFVIRERRATERLRNRRDLD